MKKIFISLFAVFIFISCDNKESYMQDFSQFIQEVEDNAEKYAEELTAEEKIEIAKCQTTYAALKAKAGIKDFGKSLKEAAQKAKEAFEEEK